VAKKKALGWRRRTAGCGGQVGGRVHADDTVEGVERRGLLLRMGLCLDRLLALLLKHMLHHLLPVRQVDLLHRGFCGTPLGLCGGAVVAPQPLGGRARGGAFPLRLARRGGDVGRVCQIDVAVRQATGTRLASWRGHAAVARVVSKNALGGVEDVVEETVRRWRGLGVVGLFEVVGAAVLVVSPTQGERGSRRVGVVGRSKVPARTVGIVVERAGGRGLFRAVVRVGARRGWHGGDRQASNAAQSTTGARGEGGAQAAASSR
jgi:hypothetical protein